MYTNFPNKLLRIISSLWIWLSIAAATVLSWLAQMCVWPLTAAWDPQRRVCGRIFRLGAVSAVKLSPLWSFAIWGALPARRPTRTVVVSNHVSHLDAFLIAHLPWEMKWLAKDALFRVPFLGWSMSLAGDIRVARDRGESIGRAMRRCAAYLAANMPVFIFPEGTRSSETGMRPFKDGAFRLAIESGANILPLAVAGTQRALPKNAWIFDRSRGRVTVGEPVSTAGMVLADVPRLKELVRRQIEQMLKVLEPQVALGHAAIPLSTTVQDNRDPLAEGSKAGKVERAAFL